LRATGVADPAGDIAFDEDPCSTEAASQTISIVQFDDI
jgi:tRNA 2-thiocytidine biosynthesis protein TtcA